MSFVDQVFDAEFKDRLSLRADPMRTVFLQLQQKIAHQKQLRIVETYACDQASDSDRDAWIRNGQSTALFDRFAQFAETVGIDVVVDSILADDNDEHNDSDGEAKTDGALEQTKFKYSARTRIMSCADEIDCLSRMAADCGPTPSIDLLYLSAAHLRQDLLPQQAEFENTKEFFAIKTALRPGALVVIDGAHRCGNQLSALLADIQCESLIDGHQRVWRFAGAVPRIVNVVTAPASRFSDLDSQDSARDRQADFLCQLLRSCQPAVAVRAVPCLEKRAWPNSELADVNIFVEAIDVGRLTGAPTNVLLLSEREFRRKYQYTLPFMDSIITHSGSAQQSLQALGYASVRLDSADTDRFNDQPAGARDWMSVFHCGGRDPHARGTSLVWETWKRHPDLPQLVLLCSSLHEVGIQRDETSGECHDPDNVFVISEHVPPFALKEMLNHYAVQLCPRAMDEPYLHEVMSCAALSVTNRLHDDGTDEPDQGEPDGETRAETQPAQQQSQSSTTQSDENKTEQRAQPPPDACIYFDDDDGPTSNADETCEALYKCIQRVAQWSIEQKQAQGDRCRQQYLDRCRRLPSQYRKWWATVGDGDRRAWLEVLHGNSDDVIQRNYRYGRASLICLNVATSSSSSSSGETAQVLHPLEVWKQPRYVS